MRSIAILGATALALAIAAPAMAQTTDSSPPPANDAAAAPATTSAAPAAVAVGQPVKDKAGATIGEVTQVKPDASGRQMATIKMGADSFAVDASSLAVDNGAAVINASAEEIKGMMKK